MTLRNISKKETNRWPHILVFAAATILASQIKLTVASYDFVISMGVVLLSLVALLVEDVPFTPIWFLSVCGIYASRAIFNLASPQPGFTSHNVFIGPLPEIAFYLVYGALILLLFRTRLLKNRHGIFLALLVPVDCLANNTELFIRIQSGVLSPQLQFGLLIVAVIRTAAIIMIYHVIVLYGFQLIRKEQQEHYTRLIQIMSQLQGEVIWLNKNSAQLENAMKYSYDLYHALQENGGEPELAMKALQSATEIHEIKREYKLIMRGLSEAMKVKADEGMYISEIFNLLQDSFSMLCESMGRSLHMNTKIDTSIYTSSPYYLMSVFRNLINNAIEADNSKDLHIKIEQLHKDTDYLTIAVTNYGKEIPPENLDRIFSPGFSTKFDDNTGEMNRGLGLPLVKDILENKFNGKCEVESKDMQTTFTCYMQIDKLR